ncbi:MAG: TRAM domain-containing protein [Halobacteria archaeon]|nr:TRAM domain-containing protein [Halobacteria archaeon]
MRNTCPILDECDAATSRDGCAHFTDKAGKDWCRKFDFSPVKDPVKPGQVVEVEIDDADDRGNGVGRLSDSGFVVRVDGGIPGKKAKAKIQTVYDNSAKAELVEFTGDIDVDAGDEEEDEEERRRGSRDDWFGN